MIRHLLQNTIMIVYNEQSIINTKSEIIPIAKLPTLSVVLTLDHYRRVLNQLTTKCTIPISLKLMYYFFVNKVRNIFISEQSKNPVTKNHTFIHH